MLANFKRYVLADPAGNYVIFCKTLADAERLRDLSDERDEFTPDAYYLTLGIERLDGTVTFEI